MNATTIWSAVTWRRVGVVFIVALAFFLDLRELHSDLHPPTRIIGVVRKANGLPIEQVFVQVFPNRHYDFPENNHDPSGLGFTKADGSYSVERQAERGVVLTLIVTHREYKPYTTTLVADRQEHEIAITLEREPEWQPSQFKSGDPAELWTGGAWCDAMILRVGAKDSATPEGTKDMTGKYYIRVSPLLTGYAEFWESADSLRPRGLRGTPKCLDETEFGNGSGR